MMQLGVNAKAAPFSSHKDKDDWLKADFQKACTQYVLEYNFSMESRLPRIQRE
jgi:hypothetical protein